MLENKIDALFLFRTFNDKTVNYIDSEKDIIYVDIDFETTYFDQLFQYIILKNSNVLIGVDSIDDLLNKIGFQTRMSRTVLITNNSSKEDITYSILKTIYGHNDYLTNVLTNSTQKLDKII